MSGPVCMCVRFSHGRGWTHDPERDLWVCSDCKKPSRTAITTLPKENSSTMATNNIEQFLNDLADLLAKHGFGTATEDAPAPARRGKVAAAKPAADPVEEEAEEDSDDDQADRRAELTKKDVKALRQIAVKAGFDPDDVNGASKAELIESILEDEANSSEEDEDADDEAEGEDDAPEYDRADLMKKGIRELKRIAREEFDKTAKDLNGLDKEAVIDLILGEEDAEEDESEDEDEGLTEEELREMSLAELRPIAKQYGVKITLGMKVDKIVDAILAAASEE